jgi:PAS domain-containing protein
MLLNRLSNPFWGIYFDGDDPPGGGGGGGSQGDDPLDPNNNDADTGGDGGGEDGDGEKRFSQADVDRIVGDRAKRAGKSAVTDFLKSLGFEKPDELKTLVEAQRQAAEKEKTDLQKAEEKAQEEERKRQALETQLQQERLDRAIEREAQALGFADVTDATALVDRALIETGDDGAITGVKEALEKLLEAKPHLKRQGDSEDPPDPKGSVPPSPPGDKKPKKMTDDERRKKAASVRQYW